MTHTVKNWVVTFKAGKRVYVRNAEFTKEGVVTYNVVAGVVLLSKDAEHLPKYVREFIKKQAVKGAN